MFRSAKYKYTNEATEGYYKRIIPKQRQVVNMKIKAFSLTRNVYSLLIIIAWETKQKYWHVSHRPDPVGIIFIYKLGTLKYAIAANT